MQQPIYISAINSASALGTSKIDFWRASKNAASYIKKYEGDFAAQISKKAIQEIQLLQNENSKYKSLDPTVLIAIVTARKALKNSGWKKQENFGINVGASRGATQTWEKNYLEFLTTKKTNVLSSPNTTLGNISSWVAHDLQTQGPVISHSITCSTGLHAILNAITWLQSGNATYFLAGASEMATTPFTIAQMKALKIYATHSNEDYPCKALDLEKNYNSMVLGEGASMVCLQKNKPINYEGKITNIGYATEILKHGAALSANAYCFQKSMKMALQNTNYNEIDAIITHMPGTIKGDLAEYKAIKAVFGKTIPALTNNKWKLGHTLATSGLLSLELATSMIQQETFIGVPYVSEKKPKQLKKILVNAVGFGGNAVSILVEK